MKVAKIGDKVTAHGQTYEIGKILYQEYWESQNLWDIEFLDPNGGYHHWKQSYDGGYLIEKRTVWVVTKTYSDEKTLRDFTEILGVFDSEEKARAVQEDLIGTDLVDYLNGDIERQMDVCIEEHDVQ